MFKKITSTILSTVLVVGVSASYATAGVIPIAGDTADGWVTNEGSNYIDNTNNFLIGGLTSPSRSTSGIMVFQLPAIPSGEVVTDASVSINFLNHQSGSLSNTIDVYGLGYRGSSAISANDHYVGTFNGDATDSWALHDDFLLAVAFTGAAVDNTIYSTSGNVGTGSVSLLAYLEAQYTAGAEAGDYVFIRLSASNPAVGQQNRVFIDSANTGSGATLPTLTLTTESIPEPASLAMAAFGGLFMAMKRRR